MSKDESPVGFRNPPVETRFKKGQSGNPKGRPSRKATFFSDAAEILGGSVTGKKSEKTVSIPMMQAMFRTMCRQALTGDNQALRRIIELQLVLVPAAEAKSASFDAEVRQANEILAKIFGLDPSQIKRHHKKKTPEQKAEDRRIAKLVQQERKRLEKAQRE